MSAPESRAVTALDLLPGHVIVQPRGHGVVLREVLAVQRMTTRGGAEWVLVRASEGTAPLGLEYPARCPVSVTYAWSLPRPPKPDRPDGDPPQVVRVRNGSSNVAHLAEEHTLHCWDDPHRACRRADGHMLCGRHLSGGRVLPADVGAEVCLSCESELAQVAAEGGTG